MLLECIKLRHRCCTNSGRQTIHASIVSNVVSAGWTRHVAHTPCVLYGSTREKHPEPRVQFSSQIAKQCAGVDKNNAHKHADNWALSCSQLITNNNDSACACTVIFYQGLRFIPERTLRISTHSIRRCHTPAKPSSAGPMFCSRSCRSNVQRSARAHALTERTIEPAGTVSAAYPAAVTPVTLYLHPLPERILDDVMVATPVAPVATVVE
jgi:hypothetical protein